MLQKPEVPGAAPTIVVWYMCNHKNTKSGLELSSNAHVDPFLTRPAADRVQITVMQAALSRRECKQYKVVTVASQWLMHYTQGTAEEVKIKPSHLKP